MLPCQQQATPCQQTHLLPHQLRLLQAPHPPPALKTTDEDPLQVSMLLAQKQRLYIWLAVRERVRNSWKQP